MCTAGVGGGIDECHGCGLYARREIERVGNGAPNLIRPARSYLIRATTEREAEVATVPDHVRVALRSGLVDEVKL